MKKPLPEQERKHGFAVNELAGRIKPEFYDRGKPLEVVIRQYRHLAPESWIRDVIFYRRHVSDDLSADGELL